MTLTIHTDQVPLRIDDHGDVRIGKSNVLLDLVIEQFEEGHSPEAIVYGYDTLNLPDVYAVIAYYLRHKDEVNAFLAQREREAVELRKKLEAAGMSDPDF